MAALRTDVHPVHHFPLIRVYHKGKIVAYVKDYRFRSNKERHKALQYHVAWNIREAMPALKSHWSATSGSEVLDGYESKVIKENAGSLIAYTRDQEDPDDIIDIERYQYMTIYFTDGKIRRLLISADAKQFYSLPKSVLAYRAQEIESLIDAYFPLKHKKKRKFSAGPKRSYNDSSVIDRTWGESEPSVFSEPDIATHFKATNFIIEPAPPAEARHQLSGWRRFCCLFFNMNRIAPSTYNSSDTNTDSKSINSKESCPSNTAHQAHVLLIKPNGARKYLAAGTGL